MPARPWRLCASRVNRSQTTSRRGPRRVGAVQDVSLPARSLPGARGRGGRRGSGPAGRAKGYPRLTPAQPLGPGSRAFFRKGPTPLGPPTPCRGPLEVPRLLEQHGSRGASDTYSAPPSSEGGGPLTPSSDTYTRDVPTFCPEFWSFRSLPTVSLPFEMFPVPSRPWTQERRG